MTVDFLSFAYAATIAAGGIIGYVKAGEFNTLKLCDLRTFGISSFFARCIDLLCSVSFFLSMSGCPQWVIGCRLQRLNPDLHEPSAILFIFRLKLFNYKLSVINVFISLRVWALDHCYLCTSCICRVQAAYKVILSEKLLGLNRSRNLLSGYTRRPMQ